MESQSVFVARMDKGSTRCDSGFQRRATGRLDKYLLASVNLRWPLATQQIEQAFGRTRKLYVVINKYFDVTLQSS